MPLWILVEEILSHVPKTRIMGSARLDVSCETAQYTSSDTYFLELRSTDPFRSHMELRSGRRRGSTIMTRRIWVIAQLARIPLPDFQRRTAKVLDLHLLALRGHFTLGPSLSEGPNAADR